jgi:hypothetical protein
MCKKNELTYNKKQNIMDKQLELELKIERNNNEHKSKLTKIGGIYYRTDETILSPDKRNQELEDVLKAYTNYENWFEEFRPFWNIYVPNHNKCVCSCNLNNKLYLVIHKPTNQSFAIGSKCITYFVEHFDKMVQFAKKNGTCSQCNIYKVLKDTPFFHRNSEKNSKTCFFCKGKQRKEEKLKLKNFLYYRDLHLQKYNQSLLDYEKEINQIALNIKYHEKDKYKQEYETIWSKTYKKWFIKLSHIIDNEDTFNRIVL